MATGSLQIRQLHDRLQKQPIPQDERPAAATAEQGKGVQLASPIGQANLEALLADPSEFGSRSNEPFAFLFNCRSWTRKSSVLAAFAPKSCDSGSENKTLIGRTILSVPPIVGMQLAKTGSSRAQECLEFLFPRVPNLQRVHVGERPIEQHPSHSFLDRLAPQ